LASAAPKWKELILKVSFIPPWKGWPRLQKEVAVPYNLRVRKLGIAGLGLLALLLALPSFPQKVKSPKDLPPEYRKWLEEEVVYIISKKEREVFLQLESNRERNIFIEAFWKQRDPTPGTEENEFKTEHYRRLAYANQWFGKDSPGPGWRTDMGRVYIQLGEPKSVEKYENEPELYPTVVWFYDGLAEYGLPNAFSVIFFKKSGSGEYELYSPIKHGPQSLLIHYSGDMTDYEAAYRQLAQVNPTLADLSLSLIQGETHYSLQPSISSQVLLDVRIPSAPYEKVKTAYAEKLLRYKDIIEVEYSTNYVDNDALFAVFRDERGVSFVHYAIEPQRLSLEELQGGYRAELEVSGKVADEKGTTIYQFTREVPINLSRDQLDKVKAKLFSFQDLFPLLPGRYHVDILVKNKASKEFTSAEANLLIPEAGLFSLSQPLLANKVDLNSKYKGLSKAFLLGNIQFVPSPRNDFSPGEKMYLYFQLHNLPPELKERGAISYSLLLDEGEVSSFSRSLREYQSLPHIFETIPLSGLKPGHYQVKISLLNGEGKAVLSSSTPFYISSLFSLPRPWVLTMTQPPSSDPSFANILGNQYLNQKDWPRAKALLEAAYLGAPQEEKFAWDYCQVLMVTKDYARAKEVVLNFLKNEKTRSNFLSLGGEIAQALGEWEEAIVLYRDYLEHQGTNIVVLNNLGECHLQLGEITEALTAWEKSLEIDPNQPSLRERVQRLKEKK